MSPNAFLDIHNGLLFITPCLDSNEATTKTCFYKKWFVQLSGFSAPLQLHHENELKPCNLKLSGFFGSQYPNVLAVQFERKLRVKKQVSPKRNTWSVLYLYDAIYKNPYPFKKRLTFNKVFLCVCFIWGAGPSPLPRHVDHISVQSGAA